MSGFHDFSTLLGSTLETKQGQKPTNEVLAGKEVIGLYFSAHWCPPCRGFTPALGKFYDSIKDAKNFEIIFVSSDRDASRRYIPLPKRDVDKPFLMPVEDTFSIAGRGTVVTGRVESGVLKTGDEVAILGLVDSVKTTCTGVEMFKKQLDRGEAGDNVGALLRGVKREDVQRGQILAAPGTVPTKTKFEAEVYVLTKEEGGRHTPFFANYRPQFFIRTADVTGTVSLPEGTEMVMPGDNATLHIELIAPVALTEGLRFALREGGKTVGAGVVSKITG